MNIIQPKITVVGIGGVGGYLAALLAAHYENVTFIARGKRAESIRSNGLVLHSDYKGEHIVHPYHVAAAGEPLPIQDYVFVCVKNYSLDEAAGQISTYADEHTVVIPIMNGANPGERLRSLLPQATVLDSLIYIVSYTLDDYSVVQEGDFANIRIGSANSSAHVQEALLRVQKILTDADIDCEIAPDIDAAIWKKFILNCAYNVLTAYYNEPIGKLRSDPKKAAEYEALVLEAYQLALAKRIGVTDEDIASIIHRFYYELADNATSSLQRDFTAKRPTELETFSGYLVREASRLNLSLPTTAAMYEQLKRKTTN